MARACLAWLVVLAGCAQLFGIDDTSKAPDAAPTPGHTSLTVDRLDVGTTVVQTPLDITGLPAAIFFANNTAVTGTAAGNGWSADVAADSIEYFLPDVPSPVPRVIALPASDIHNLFGVYEHPNPSPAPAMATFSLSVGLPSAATGTEGFQLFTVGSWAVSAFPSPAAGSGVAQASITLPNPSNITGRPRDKIILDDAVLVLRFSGAKLTALLQVPPLDEVDGVNAVTGGMSPIAIDQNLAATIGAAGALTRLATVQPASTAAPTLNWSVTAAPGFAIGNATGPQLEAGAAAMTDTTIAATYGNPFSTKGWRSTFVWAPTATRTYTTPAMGPGGGLPVTLFAQLVDVLDATAAGPLVADLPAGMPQVVTLAGTPLTSDGAAVTADPATALAVSFTADTASNTLYQMQLFELDPDPTNTVLQLRFKLGFTGAQPAFTIPAGTFDPTKLYALRAMCVSGGYPGLASGDLTQRTLPTSFGLADSGVFSVVAP
jgi:hypothetical protein